MSEPKILIAFDQANNIILHPAGGHPEDGWFVIDANHAEPEVNHPGDLLSDGTVDWDTAKRIQREAQAKILAEGFALTEEQYLLICLMEECAEVTQRVSKALRFGLEEVQPGQDQTNAERISGEMSDLITVHGVLDNKLTLPTADFSWDKVAKITEYMHYSRERGLLA